MSTPTLTWPVDALRTQLAPLLPGLGVEVAGEIDSTNSELMRRARAGQAMPTLLAAELQTAGRGRMGRGWQSGDGEPGGALAFSLALPLAPRDWSGLSLAVGLAVAEALHPDIRLKWPNDLWWRGRKLAGILVETAGTGGQAAGRLAVIGVGINIAPLGGEGFATPPAWLQALLPGMTAPAALARVAAPLAQAVRAFEQQGFAPLAARFNARDALGDQPVRLSDGTEGVARGVGADGALQVRTAAGLRMVRSAEVSVRPLAREGAR
ncbi:biotin--[acetyl-CoA-carboxylase] ligase [Ottowia testudinis]|uniref:biotin--[biotin carboxyl-carrier protein] ligase n=1 Tax=Ottowia testudinis TaxID=2816950 RepID=A0A975CG34_9BURK|nr:biotin--[acetyl-CoA-carboxylase] ligase [Ottowia testudinis]QTD45565.1 biotin--[acetyl-CoA-carboxylase] ligase [Ottowia testudinis]